jgi:hypothetical protein
VLLDSLFKIGKFADLIRKIQVQAYRKKQEQQEEMRPLGPKKHPKKFFQSAFHRPILPLIPEKPLSREDNKDKFITFKVKMVVGAPAGSERYEKYVRTFEEGTPQQFIDLMHSLLEIWTQNSIEAPGDRVATVRAILKGESLAAFNTGLEDLMTDPDQYEPLELDEEMVIESLNVVASNVFPHRALDMQKVWMSHYLKKPYDLPIRQTAGALTRINNALPLFPGGTQDSKFSETELVRILEMAIPESWRRQFDLEGYIPTEDTRAVLVNHCERMERNETTMKTETKDKDDDNKKSKNSKVGKSATRRGNSDSSANNNRDRNSFFCKNCGRNKTHNTSKCFYLKKRGALAKNDDDANDDDKKPAAKPTFSKRSFRKEVNALAKKASRKGSLDVYASALKREQAKVDKAAKKREKNNDDISMASSNSDVSMHNLEAPIPRKKKVTFGKDQRYKRALDEERAFLEQITCQEKDDSDDSDAIKEIIDLTDDE